MLLKELQSLGLDVRVLKEDNTEVEIMETSDYGEVDLRSIIEGDRHFGKEEESFGQYGFSKQEFEGEELVGVEEEEEEDEDEYLYFDGDFEEE